MRTRAAVISTGSFTIAYHILWVMDEVGEALGVYVCPSCVGDLVGEMLGVYVCPACVGILVVGELVG